ncbi:hypothetical protein ACFL6O_01375 [candidate division KSB1 bacterium]
MKLIRLVSTVILTAAIMITHPSELLSQDKNLSIRLSVTKNCLSENRFVISPSSIIPPGGWSGEKDRSFNFGIIVRLFSNKYFEIEIEKFSFYEQDLDYIDDGSYYANKTSVEFTPITLSFMHRFYKTKELSLFYNTGVSWYPMQIKDTITLFQPNVETGTRDFYERSRKNTIGFGVTLGVSYQVAELLSLIVSAETRIVDDMHLDQQLEPLTTTLDGFFFKAGLLFDIF